MTSNDTLTRHAPRTPVDAAGLDAARLATFTRLDDAVVPAPRHPGRPALRWGLAAASAAALTVAGLTLPSPGDQAAFAGWRPVPATVDPETLVANADECAHLAAGTGQTVPVDSLRPVLSELRGPYAFTVVSSEEWLGYCLVGPSSHFANLDALDGTSGSASMAGQEQGEWTSTTTVDGFGDPAPGELTLATATSFEGEGADPWSTVLGRVAPDVSSVQVVLADGTTVDASAAEGVYSAWWPGTVAPVEVTGTRADGTIARAGSDVDWSHQDAPSDPEPVPGVVPESGTSVVPESESESATSGGS